MKKKMNLLIAAIASLAIVIITVSYAWYYQHAALATLMDIVPPDSIEIIPLDDNGGDVTMLDLDYNEIYGDKRDPDTKKVTIYRPLYVSSTSPVHQLEIVHTTNLEGLKFELYWTDGSKYNKIDEAIETGKSIPGAYKNPKIENPSLADPANLHNYKEGDHVEEHAYPLYWLARNVGDERYYVADSNIGEVTTVTSTQEQKYDPAKQTYRNYYKTQYYLVISWKETGKETDLFYILAKNVAVTEYSGGSVSSQ